MRFTQFWFFFLLVIHSSIATTITWNLNTMYGITQSGFSSIISDAKQHFNQSPNDTILIQIDAGTYEIGGNGSHGIAINGGFGSGDQGRVIFQGAGMDNTKLIFTEVEQRMIHGSDVNGIEFRDMHMARAVHTVTQGTVVDVSAGEIIIEIEDGFPTPLQLWKDWSQGRYLRRYTHSVTDPQVIQTDNEQIPYGYRNGTYVKPELVSGNQWRFFLNNSSLLLSHYNVGDYVGIKSKHEGDAFWFARGKDLIFENIRWTGSSRGLVRLGLSDVKILNCRIERDEPINGQTPCMATPSGGPQMNQYEPDPVATNMIIDNLYCDSPGDDCVAFFNVQGGKVINSTLRNSFATGIRISQQSYDICVAETEIPNNPIEMDGTNSTGRTPIKTFDLNEAINAGIIHDNCLLSTSNEAMPLNENFRIYNVGEQIFVEAKNELRYEILIYNIAGQVIYKEAKRVGNSSFKIKSGIHHIIVHIMFSENERIVIKHFIL